MSDQESTTTVVTSENLQDFQFARLGIDNDAAPENEEVIEPEVKENKDESKDDHEDKDEDKHKPNPKLQERFSKLTKQREEARLEAQAAKDESAALKARLDALEAPAKQAQKSEDDEPSPNDFTDAFEYARELAKWSANQALKNRERTEIEAKQKERRGKVVEAWNSKMAETKAEIPDFDDMVESSQVMVSDAVRDALIESDVGPRILYHLASNDEDAEKLTGMSTSAALRFIGRLEAKYEKVAKSETKEDNTSTKKVSVSKAPAPINPIKSTGQPTISDGENLSYSEYKALRAAGKIK